MPMEVSVYFSTAKIWEHYQMKDDGFKRLEEDYQKYLDGKSTKGGSYSMAPVSMAGGYQSERKVLLKFDDIQFK